MKLNHLTDNCLLNDTFDLSQREREIMTKVLWHLREIDRRKLFVEKGCGSLFEYCVKILKYSEAQASRRVTASRLLQEVPEVAQKIEDGLLKLSQLNQLKYFFKDENITRKEDKTKILEKIEGRTTKDTERILHELKKEKTPRNVFLVVREDTKEKLDQVRNLKAHSCPDNDSLLNKMCDEVTRIWDPTLIKRHVQGSTESRFIPKMIQAEVWQRDRGMCTKCESTYALEYDHVKPFAMGGKSTVDNLRLLCRACNQRQRVTYFQNTIPDRNAFQLKRPPP
jgi:DNA-binding TFAR19-related protein (PDSD5 family)